MKAILVIIIVFGLAIVSYMVLDYMGYYIEWESPVMAAIIATPVVQGIVNFFNRPEKKLLGNNTSFNSFKNNENNAKG